MGIYNKTDATSQLLDIYEKYIPEKLDSGMYNREDLQDYFAMFGVAGRINLMVKVLNDLEIFDELLAPITLVSSDSTMTEIWADGDWGETSATVRAEGSEITKRNLKISGKGFGHQLQFSKTELMKAMELSVQSGNKFLSPYAGIDVQIMAAVKGYKTKLRKLALSALFWNPTTMEDPTLPVLYRDTTGFAPENQVIPPRNGISTFETAEEQEHHMATATLSENDLRDMVDKIVDKGGDAGSVAIIANKKTWRKFVALFDTAELERLKFIRDLGLENLEQSPITSAFNIELPNSDMPDDYFVAMDMSKKILQKKISDIPAMQGVDITFNTIGQIAKLNPTADPETIKILAENAIMQENNIRGAIKMEVHDVGFGVIAPGSAVVLYAGGATYVEPNWEV